MPRMTGQRVQLGDIRQLGQEAGIDEPGLLDLLRSFLSAGYRYQDLDWLKAAIFDQLRAKKAPGMFLFAPGPSCRNCLPTLIHKLFDRWLELAPTDFTIVVYLFRTAAASPDGLSDKSIEAIAEAIHLSEHTVQSHLQYLDTSGAIEVLSEGKEWYPHPHPRMQRRLLDCLLCFGGPADSAN